MFEAYRAAKRAGKTHKIWQIAGGITTRQSHRDANAQKVGIDESFRVGGEDLFLPNDPEASLSETANCRCSVRYVGGIVQNNLIKHYSLQSGVILPGAIEQQVSRIADRYYNATRKNIVVTSGRRTYLRQAEVMYKLRIRRGRFGNYRAKNIITRLEDIFQQGRTDKKTGTEITREMAEIIAIYANRGVYISKHIIDGAVDIQSKYMSPKQIEAFRIAATGIAKVILLETNPDHYHLQF